MMLCRTEHGVHKYLPANTVWTVEFMGEKINSVILPTLFSKYFDIDCMV